MLARNVLNNAIVKAAVFFCAVLCSVLLTSCPQANILKVIEFGFSTIEFPTTEALEASTVLRIAPATGEVCFASDAGGVTISGVLKNPSKLTWNSYIIFAKKDGTALTPAEYDHNLQSDSFAVTFDGGVTTEGKPYTLFIPKQTVSNSNAFGGKEYDLLCYTPITAVAGTNGIANVAHVMEPVGSTNLKVSWTESLVIPPNYIGNGDHYGRTPTDVAWIKVTVKDSGSTPTVLTDYIRATSSGSGSNSVIFPSTTLTGALVVTVEIADSKGFSIEYSQNVTTQGVNFDGNGASGGTMASQEAVSGSTILLSSNSFTRTGYIFAGWATTPTGSVTYTDGASYTVGPGAVTLFAKWTANTYMVTYDSNKPTTAGPVTGSTADSFHTYDTPSALTANGYMISGYRFLGWNTQANAGGTNYADGALVSTLTPSANGVVTLYAKWSSVSAIYLDGTVTTSGDGTSPATAVKTFTEAKNLLGATGGTIWISGTVQVTASEAWDFGGNTVKRYSSGTGVNFTGAFANVTGSSGHLTLTNIVLDGQGGLGGLGGSIAATDALVTVSGSGGSCKLTVGNGAILQNNNCGTLGAGGAVGVTNGTLEITGTGKVQNNRARDGGGILVSTPTGTITMSGGSIENNEATMSGGGVFLGRDSTFTMTAGTIRNNKLSISTSALGGGGVFLFEDSIFNMSGGSITNNSVESSSFGGGIYIDDGTVNLRGNPIIKDNTKSGSPVSAHNIYIAGNTASESTLKVTGALTGVAASIGLTPANTTARFMVAQAHGYSGITASDAAKFFSDDLTKGFAVLAGNLVVDAPPLPAVYLSGSGSDSNDGSTAANAVQTFATAKNRLATNGTIWISGTVTVNTNQTWDLSTKGMATVKRSTQSGGFKGVLVTVTGNGGHLTLTDIVLDGQGNVNGLGPTAGNAVDANSPLISVESGAKLTMNNGSTLRNNSASGNGGGVAVDVTSFLTMSGTSTINNNTTSNRGGGVYNYGSFDMTGGTISDNTATVMGGGVYNDGRFDMTGGIISDNTAANGGGVYNSGRFDMTGGTISDNTAPSGVGGGVYVPSTGVFSMAGSAKVTANALKNDVFLTTGSNITIGAALLGTDKVARITPNAYIAGSQALSGTSALLSAHNNRFSVTDEGSTEWYVNTAGRLQKRLAPIVTTSDQFLDAVTNAPTTGAQQVITLTQDISVKSTVNVSGGKNVSIQKGPGSAELKRDDSLDDSLLVVSGNTSSLTLGAGVVIDGNSDVGGTPVKKSAAITITSGTVDINADIKNSYSENGGAINMSGGTVTFDTGEISGNRGGTTGGAVYLSGGTFTMNGGSINDNFAVYESNSTYGGGGVCVYGGAFYLNAGTISDNQARMGGGVLVRNGTFTMTGGSIENNTALGNGEDFGGGGVYLGYGPNPATGTINLTGGTIQNNSVNGGASKGGGVRALKGTVVIGGVTITGNTASSGKKYFINKDTTFNGSVLSANAVQE